VLGWLAAAAMAAALAVTLVTGVDYAVKGWQVRRAALSADGATPRPRPRAGTVTDDRA
jgi:CDP-diacylglycerol--glycerol-3-phosphate 3-phosphatidyltransferase